MALTDLDRAVATATTPTVLVTRFHSYDRQHSSPLNRFDSRLARLADMLCISCYKFRQRMRNVGRGPPPPPPPLAN